MNQDQDISISAANDPSAAITITEKAPTRAFSWLKVPTSTFTIKTLWVGQHGFLKLMIIASASQLHIYLIPRGQHPFSIVS